MTQQADCHFYLSSVATWVTTGRSRTLREAIKLMDREGFPYAIWFVPAPPDENYEIRMFAPQVKGAKMVEFVEAKAPKRRKEAACL